MMVSKKSTLSIGLMSVLLSSSMITPASATFYQTNEGQIPASQKVNLPMLDLEKKATDDPLYGQDLKAFNPNENVRLIIEVDVNEKLRTTPEKQVEAVKNTFMNKRDDSSKVIHTYSTGFYGFSMETTMKDAEKIKEIKGVKDIRIAKTYEHMDVKSNELVEAMNVWTKYNYSGDGMVVAIVDSGIDYRHEAMTLSDKGKKKAKYNEDNIQEKLDESEVDDVWYTDKVPTGYDWADHDTNVIPASNAHGTHVAGIVGAYEESQKKAMGVAPDVQLLAEKVFSDKRSGAYDDDIAAGIYHAVEFGADVINLSLGSDAGSVDSNDPVQRAIQYATEHGVLVVAAAGNASYSTKQNLLERSQLPLAKNPDIGLVGDPGVTPSALQVASSENDQMSVNAFSLNDGSKLGYQTQYSSKKFSDELEAGKEYELIFAGEGFGSHLDGLDLEGKIVVAKLTKSYSIYSSLQYDSARKGAVGLIVIPPDHYPSYANLNFSRYTIPAVTTGHTEGDQLVERLKSGEKISVQMSDENLWVQNPTTEPMSYFSSYGSPTDLSFKPEITAPGGKISSTVLNNEYEVMSGTSMATPHVAAGAALLLEKYYEELGLPKNEETVLKAKNALMNTSEVLTNPDDENSFYSPRRQGSGLMKIEQAIKSPYLVEHVGAPLEKAASVALKEVDRTFDFTLDVEPLSKKLEKANDQYEIVVDVLMDETEKKTYNGVERDYLTLHSVPIDGAVVKINGKQLMGDEKIQYKPRRDGEVKISVTLPEELSECRFVEGFVRFVPKGSSVKDLATLTMPFMGYYGDWDAIDNIDESPVNGDPFLGYTVLWNDMLTLPMGYSTSTGTFDPNEIGYSKNAVPTGMYPSFTAFRNLKEMSLKVEDENGKTVAHITNFGEFTEDGSPYPFRKNIMSYGNYSYKFDGMYWSGTDDDGNKLPDGNYTYIYESTLNYEGAKTQQTKIPIKLDSGAPVVKNINIAELSDGKYKITWDVQEEGTKHIGNFIWVNDGYQKSVSADVNEYISDEKPEIVMISAIDGLRNVGVGYTGNEELLHAGPFINYLNVSGTNVNETKPASILIFGYKRLDWHIEISNAEGEMIEYADIENEHSIYGLKWYAGTEYPDGDYYVTVTGTDETGLSLTSEKKKITVKH
ncbi:S8 family serine peptidase [Rossellomorea aquimaris]|uniref:S8 family serine peptidase n=1 Tax=Rossellomorea aquimaris TaxID=189382 RepID=UPI001CD7D0CE|nr:S8 family serine peptidase [Rossellomorea aquimaris]MCA1061265.1 S8 family serine peptidase [Rossellomorea aquimaris]